MREDMPISEYKNIECLLSLKSENDLKKLIIEKHMKVINNIKYVYIFGAKGMGQKIYGYLKEAHISVKAFIDNDDKKQSESICGLKIIKLNKIKNKNSIIVIASLNYAFDMMNQCYSLGFNNVIYYPILSIYDKKRFPEGKSFNNMTLDLICNKEKYLDTFNKLEDEKSKRVFDSIIGFRLSFNLKYILDIHDDTSSEYFDNIVNLSDNEVFVDGWAYIGDTALEFIKRVKSYKRIYEFEPDKNILNIAKKNLSSFKNIEFMKLGISNKNCTLKFNSTGDTGGSISNDGDISIDVDSLDNCINDKITFLKLDVEGSEIEAIDGAKRHILNDRPKIIVCVYHKPDHLWRVMDTICSIRNDYKFYLRHYGKSNFDTILYCL